MKKVLLIICLFLASCWANNEEKISENQKEAKEQKTILALWDSLTAWYGLNIEASYPSQLENILQEDWYNYKVINAWISGDTSKWVVERLSLYEDLDLDLVILVIGANDGFRGNSIEDLKKNIITTVGTFKKQWAQVILWWMDIPLNLWLSYRSSFKKVYQEVAKSEDVPLIDFFLEWVAWDRSLNLPDGIHPTQEWYTIVVNNLYNFLVRNQLIKKW
jgi:acyl-CoA thioesterase-1